jgi:hypothetical protein
MSVGDAEDDPERDDSADLGRRWRTYRQRRKSRAPIYGALIATAFGLLILIEIRNFADAIRVMVVIIPLGIVLGFAVDFFARIPVPEGRLRLEVYDRGVVVMTGHGRRIVEKPAVLYAGKGQEVHAAAPHLALEWTGGPRGRVRTPLDAFGSSGSLRRALADGHFTTYPFWPRLGFGAAGAVMLVVLYPWLFPPVLVPEHEGHIAAFCQDPSQTFPESPRYEGAGPHPIQVWVDDNHWDERGVLEAMSGRGWSTAAESAELIACGVAESTGTTVRCGYTEFGRNEVVNSVVVSLVAYRVTVYEAATHAQVDEVLVEDEKDTDLACPHYLDADAVDYESLPSSEAVLEALSPIVNDAALS